MAGSESDPVILDPFRTIVEVGWRSIPEFIKVVIRIGSDSTGDGLIACPAEYPDPFPYSGVNLTDTYLVTYVVDNVIEAGVPYSLTAIGYWRTHSRFMTVDSGEHPVTISGVPDGPFIDQSPAAWTYTYVGFAGSSGHGVRVTALSADEFDDPDYPSLPDDFYSTTSQPLAMLAHAITDAPACGWQDPGPPPTNYMPSQSAPDTGTGANADEDIYFAAAATIGSATLNFAGVTVSYRGETYSPIAISGSTENTYLRGDDATSISVLCKRNTVAP